MGVYDLVWQLFDSDSQQKLVWYILSYVHESMQLGCPELEYPKY